MPPTTTISTPAGRRGPGPGRHYRVYPAEIRATKEGDGSSFEGYCAVLHGIDEYGTIMAKGCFDRDIEGFRARGFVGGLNHNWSDPIGKIEDAQVDDKGLKVKCSVVDTTHGLDVRKLLKAGVVRSLSFGFDDLEKRWLDREDDVWAYWASCGYTPRPEDEERCKKGALLFTRLKVYEASPVMAPGNIHADITDVRADSDGSDPGRTYQSLENHVLTVQAAVEDLALRIEQLAALRASDGRSLPPERRAVLRSIRDRLDRAMTACQPLPTAAEVASLRREAFHFTLLK